MPTINTMDQLNSYFIKKVISNDILIAPTYINSHEQNLKSYVFDLR